MTSLFLFCSWTKGEVEVPTFRMRMGTFVTTINAGTQLRNQELGSMVTLQPTLLWALPTFRSRIGVHFLSDIASDYGLTPLSGIGFSGYFYPYGISSSYDMGVEQVLQQKFRISPFFFGGITPCSLNINTPAGDSKRASSFNAFIFDITLGAGIDYPFRPNIIMSLDFNYRFGSAPNNRSEVGGINYKGMGIMLAYSTTYY